MPGLFDSLQLRGLSLRNRIMVSPMCQYQAGSDARVNDWHLVHYGSLALGGAALVMIEATAVEARGRISEQDLGLYEDAQINGLRRIVEFSHQQGIPIGVQLGHAGRKADLTEAIVAPSALAFHSTYKLPQALTPTQLDEIVAAFAKAAERAVFAGFDCVEIHAAHGYLLHQFLSPASNQRGDEFGGSLDHRLLFPLRVLQAVRQVVPNSMPIFVRVSGSEYLEDGYSVEDMVYYSKKFREMGADLIDVSSGGNQASPPPTVYAGYQVPFAQAIRAGAEVPVASVGMLDDAVLADSVVQSGRADVIAIGRGFLRNKHWGHKAAQTLGHSVVPPKSYERAY